nr:hypothetical protein [Alphaproteobacteria bacterium]
MKKLHAYNAILCGAMLTTSVNAASICSSYGGDIIPQASWTGFCPNGNGGRSYVSPASDPWANCSTKGYWCYYNAAGQAVVVPTCITCMSGFNQEYKSLAASNSTGVCSNDIHYNACVVQSSSTAPTCNKTQCEANNNTYYKYT